MRCRGEAADGDAGDEDARARDAGGDGQHDGESDAAGEAHDADPSGPAALIPESVKQAALVMA